MVIKTVINNYIIFLACSPKWIDYEDSEAREEQKVKMNTKYDIVYWVNYTDSDDNYG
jgi:hypothetical protein